MEDEVTLINAVLQTDRYAAEAKINQGSYGEIFRVKHKDTNVHYALKAMQLEKLDHMGKGHQAALEILVLQKLKHPGVIKLYEVIRTPKYIGLVLELCPYGDVFTLMRTVNKKIDLAFKKRKIMVYYLAQILEALNYLHSKKVIHRDLKPENIVLGEDLKIRIIDFGTAKVNPEGELAKPEQLDEIEQLRRASQLLEQQKSRVSFVGTSNYMSPESIDLRYSPKSDIWAFGILAYKFYFNKLPYEGKDSLEIFKKIKISALPIDNDVEPEFQQLFEVTLCKDPEQRPTTEELKKIRLFQGTNFKEIFEKEAPIKKEELAGAVSQLLSSNVGNFLFERALQKKMFFGNYKPRCLTISKIGDRLIMAYRYIPSKKVKNEFELNLNDYAATLKNNEFEVVTTDKRYRFRTIKNESPEVVVSEINAVIKKGYALQ